MENEITYTGVWHSVEAEGLPKKAGKYIVWHGELKGIGQNQHNIRPALSWSTLRRMYDGKLAFVGGAGKYAEYWTEFPQMPLEPQKPKPIKFRNPVFKSLDEAAKYIQKYIETPVLQAIPGRGYELNIFKSVWKEGALEQAANEQ